MVNNKVIIIGGLVAGAAGFVFSKSVRVKNFLNALLLQVKTKLAGYSGGKININAEVKIDNPKNMEITMKKPVIRIYSEDGQLITNSIPTSEQITISKRSQTSINYEFKVPLLSSVLYNVLLNAGATIDNILAQLSSGSLNELLGVKLIVKVYLDVNGVEKEIIKTVTI